MNHLEAGFAGKNNIWRYAVMIAAVFIAANTVGAIPLIIGFSIKTVSDPGSISTLAENPNDLSALGFDPNVTLFMLLFPFLAAVVAFRLLIKPLNNRDLFQTINGTSSIRWNRIIVSALLWLVFSAIYLIVYKGIDTTNFKVNNVSGSLINLIIISLLLIPFQASLEEVVFRGYLMQGFGVLMKNRWLPVVVTSVLFGIMHSWNPEIKEFGFFNMMPQYVLFGLLFGLITIIDDGIEIAIGAHSANNIFLSIMVTNSASTLQTPAVFEQIKIMPWIEFGALAVTAALFFLVLKKIYRWNDFSLLWKGIGAESEIVHTE
jgi:uncharacterized protein